MKKTLALFLSLALLFTLVPFGTSAVEMEHSDHNTLVNKAADAFPEYAEKLLNPSYSPSVYSRNATARVLVVNDTRLISDTESITYAEYSDGLILLSDNRFDYESSGSCIQGTSCKNCTINVVATCVTTSNYDGCGYVDGVSYTLYTGDNNFDKITDPGSPREGTNCTKCEQVPNSYIEWETYINYAQVSYDLIFYIGNNQSVNSRLTITVGEDTAIINHMDRT